MTFLWYPYEWLISQKIWEYIQSFLQLKDIFLKNYIYLEYIALNTRIKQLTFGLILRDIFLITHKFFPLVLISWIIFSVTLTAWYKQMNLNMLINDCLSIEQYMEMNPLMRVFFSLTTKLCTDDWWNCLV